VALLSSPASAAAAEESGNAQSTAQTQAVSEATRASRLIGKKVKNQQGEELGTIKDLILSRDGQIDYFILARNGLFGMGGKLVPVPWEVANAKTGDNALLIDIAKSRLDNAPSFASDQWPNFGEPMYQQKIFGYYQQEPNGARPEHSPSGADQ